ncbi:hypothetical protein ML401_21610 [Bradyrhizobium sp. 62B]|jgi:hypothetical protein|nr:MULTISPECIES: hypothetical protein [Bradyrhizobium]WIW44104.1 hypothetical protein ML401_21610 [Bradyrhizobium sp. 62B]MBR0702904.1 hypothetical protein [Bradyrhizobium diazoefficiens]MBR0771659.1 hypothetical protein [Bradyrhizobium diazoefficiens]MCS3758463.1 hypothetical protein [Bradyrhizobium centrosematis]MCS3773648.1 hypothetical protein [Bradyrhizobium centrosematis]
MTTTLVWTGVALWLAFNAAIAARSLYVMRPVKAEASARIIHLHRRRV